MQFCSSAHSVLTLLLIIFTVGCESAVDVVTVEYKATAVLPCSGRCSGVASWTPSDKSSVFLAQCNQTSCRSVKEGYQMNYNQYLQGDLSLIITEADFSKRMWYTCRCDGEAVCDVSLRIRPFSYPVHVQAGQPLILDLPIPDDVEVTFNRTEDGGSSTFKLCTIEGHKPYCESLYEKRVSFGSGLQLKEVKDQDGGTYILRDIKNDEVIGMYTVTINKTRPVSSDDNTAKETPPGQDGSVAMVVAVVFGALLAIAILVIFLLFVKNHQLRKCLRRLQNPPQISMSQLEPGEEQQEERPVERKETEDQPDVPVRTPVMETDDRERIVEQKKVQDDPEDEADTSGVETDPLLETDSPVTPASVTDEPPLSHPVPDSCSSNTRNRVF